MDNGQNLHDADRMARIRSIKRILIGGPYFVAAVSIILCIVALIQIGGAERQVDAATLRLSQIQQSQDELQRNVEILAERQSANEDVLRHLQSDVNTLKASALSPEEIVAPPEGSKWPKKAYLTFDDGPNSNTEAILDILAKYNVVGNFFVVGAKSDSQRAIYSKILQGGHVLGMHSFSHKYSQLYASEEAFETDLLKLQDMIYDETGFRPVIFRFPGGSSNKVSPLPLQNYVDILDKHGIQYYDWNVSVGDASSPSPSADEIVENALSGLDKYDEVMILMHDLPEKTATLEALPRIIEGLCERGIVIAPIDETSELIQHVHIENINE